MDLVLVFTLSLCFWAAEARSYWSGPDSSFSADKPDLLVNSDEIKDGESVEMTCLLPIDYGGGECRLYRQDNRFPLKVVRESGYLCVFHLSSAELLGRKPVGSRMLFTCDYHLQQYTSIHSDLTGVTVTGSGPSPSLSVHGRIVSLSDRVEVNCTPPVQPVSSCHFYRDDFIVARGPCVRKLTGKELAVWEKPALLLPVNLTCKYYPHPDLEIRSERSNHILLLVLDPGQASSSMDCRVQVEDDQLEAFGDRSQMFVGEDGQMISVQVSNINQTTNKTLECVQKPDVDP